MLPGFVLITTETDAMDRVLDALKNVKGLEEAYSVYGTYDIIANIKAEDEDNLKEIVSVIRRREGVRTTLTMIVIPQG